MFGKRKSPSKPDLQARRRMTLISAIVMVFLCMTGNMPTKALAAVTPPPSENGELYGYVTEILATRTGPSTLYDGGGTYNVQGQWIRVLSRAYDEMSRSWWVKCEIPYSDQTYVLWTGYKRFDSGTLPLESIPVEEVSNPLPSSETEYDSAFITEPEETAPDPAEEPPVSEMPADEDRDNGETEAARPTQWDTAFSEFIASHKFLGLGQRFYDGVSISMRDLDQDGIPEIMIWNGADSQLYEDMSNPPVGAVYVYSYTDGHVEYTGSFFEGGAYPDETVMTLENKPGVFIFDWSELDNPCDYVYLQDGQLMTEKTSQAENTLWDNTRYTRWYTLDQVDRIGCPLFLEAPFELGNINMDFGTDDQFSVGEPITVSVSITSGRPPYNVSVCWYELDNEGMIVQDLATDTFTTDEVEFVREYRPESSTYTIGVEVYASDVFGTPAFFDEPVLREIVPRR